MMPRQEKIPFLGRGNDEAMMTMENGNVNARLQNTPDLCGTQAFLVSFWRGARNCISANNINGSWAICDTRRYASLCPKIKPQIRRLQVRVLPDAPFNTSSYYDVLILTRLGHNIFPGHSLAVPAILKPLSTAVRVSRCSLATAFADIVNGASAFQNRVLECPETRVKTR
jgi:hypothetical protein